MEPWDGPAAMAFTDGRQIGATLDRNGLRPARYFVTDDGLVVMASETGVLPFPEEKIVEKWRLQPGKMLLIDLEKGCIVSDEEIKAELAGAHPYQHWLDRTQIHVHELPGGPAPAARSNVSLLDRQQAFGYTQELLKFLMIPMAQTGQEAIGSMGTDTPISALSDRPKLLHTYFKQNFAQVTNPPIDPIREELVMSLVTFIGPRPNLLDLEGTSKQKRLEAAHPILTNENLERIRAIGKVADNQFRTVTLDITYPAEKAADGMGRALEKLCHKAEDAVRKGENIIILSDRATGPDRIPIPSLLATSAVHHHLIRCGLRTSVGLVVETGEACEVNQFCTLAGYGAEAINPYLAFETIEAMVPEQNFAQVTNPPIDPIREELVMSLVTFIGPRPNLLDLEGTSKQKRLEAAHPILTNENLERIRAIGKVADNQFRTVTLDITYPAEKAADGMGRALEKLCHKAEDAVRKGENIIILSDRATGPDRIPVRSLLATSAVHHHLIRCGLRTSVGLVVETGEACEVNQFCALAGYGAEAINPYLAFESIEAMVPDLDEELTAEEAIKRYMKATDKGILKVMSKMGISTYQSYCGAQIFDAVGLRSGFVAKYFTGTNTQVEGVGLDEIARETVERHRLAFGDVPVLRNALEVGGEYAFRVRGETHAWRPQVVADLQHAVRGQLPEKYREFAQAINEQSEQLLTLRGMFRIKTAAEMGRAPVPLDEVEPAEEIVKRFATGAMSFGSISREAHTTLAIAMNRIGGRSNTGEGGEEVDRFTPLPNGDSMRSAIKQVASGRFGVTTEYLVNSDMMQIKMAQGAKPGEGGQLPGHKVDATIAKVRHSTPGVGLISPPPHHDIYSIEDLKQLIFDLKNVNPTGDVSVKLVSEIGVGTVAAGVAKAMADHVTIAGFEGGTGASPLTSIKHAGSPWEIGLAETQQTLVLNRLRGRIAVQVDGGVRTGRDVVVGALLGADEFGFSTAPLIAAGCIMMRKCHLNTCPVGIATQDPVLRARFTGAPEHVINFFFYVAEEVREYMASLGFRTFAEMIGHTEVLDKDKAIDHWKARGLDFTRLFHKPEVADKVPTRNTERQDHGLETVLDNKLIELCRDAVEERKPVKLDLPIRNVDRSTGAMLSGEIAKRYGHAGLPDDTIWIRFKGSAGQSFGAWLAHGVTLDLVGEGNDYVGKGLSGGRIIVRPPAESAIVPEKSIIVGNTVLYGAVGGECYFRGVGGERFGVRNSGAIAVVEGTGDHGCEYMTGGVVAVIGPTGRNFAAGMSGGIAYVLDEEGDFERRCNMAMVDLEPVPSENQVMERRRHQGGDLESHGLVDLTDMTRFDEERLHQMIENHLHYTGSSRAREILDNWAAYLPKFVKVMPVEYRRALEEMARQQVADKTGLGEIEIGLRGNGK